MRAVLPTPSDTDSPRPRATRYRMPSGREAAVVDDAEAQAGEVALVYTGIARGNLRRPCDLVVRADFLTHYGRLLAPEA